MDLVDSIIDIVEAVSFYDNLGEMGRMISTGLSEDRVILVSSVEMYDCSHNV